MGVKIGLWIDHRKAVIMFLTESGAETRLVVSNVERQLRRAGDSPLKGAFERIKFANDINRKRQYVERLGTYYDSVIACIREADAILSPWGPGEAKEELKHRLEAKGFGARITGAETAGLMTGRQLESRIRNSFRGAGKNT